MVLFSIFSDAKGNNLGRNSVYVEPEDGLDIYLTVDYGIQIIY